MLAGDVKVWSDSSGDLILTVHARKDCCNAGTISLTYLKQLYMLQMYSF